MMAVERQENQHRDRHLDLGHDLALGLLMRVIGARGGEAHERTDQIAAEVDGLESEPRDEPEHQAEERFASRSCPRCRPSSRPRPTASPGWICPRATSAGKSAIVITSASRTLTGIGTMRSPTNGITATSTL